MNNKFLNAIFKNNTITENGALSNSSTGSVALNYFSKCGTYRGRALREVFSEISGVWNEDPKQALQLIFYNRMITRKIKGFSESEDIQMGQGNRNEFLKAIIWVARYEPENLYKNLWIVPLIGCWKDLWHMDLIDELDNAKVFELIQRGINCDYNRELIAKYLPRIRSKSNTYNERHVRLNTFAYAFIKFIKWTPKQYRKFKSQGKAHDFQKKMSSGLFDEINFNSIPGKALYQMVNNRGKDQKTTFERHGIDKAYLEWIKDQPVAKFTGYVYELMKVVNHSMSLAQKHTVDKQFDGLIQKAISKRPITKNVWCALDTSGSMGAQVANTTAYDICLGLGVYFSTLNQGAFKDNVIMFDNTSQVKQLSGKFSDKVMQLKNSTTAWGSTNFQSVIDEIVRIRRSNPEIPISDFPDTLIVVSDMQFNPVNGNSQTNYNRAMDKLARVGLPKMTIVWWWVTGRAMDFPSTLDDENVIMIGGFDGAILSLLLDDEPIDPYNYKEKKKISPYESMQKALNQELLSLVHI
ncbi:MAG: DUF2828 family protein [Bacteroidota bacterium]